MSLLLFDGPRAEVIRGGCVRRAGRTPARALVANGDDLSRRLGLNRKPLALTEAVGVFCHYERLRT